MNCLFMKTIVKKLSSRNAGPLLKMSFILTYISLQGTVLEKKYLVFLLKTNS